MAPPIVKSNPETTQTQQNVAPATDVFQENLNTLYANLYRRISGAAEEARRTGKPLLIVVGEKHGIVSTEQQSESTYESTVVELMTLDIAKKLGIRNMVAEADSIMLRNVETVVGDPVRTNSAAVQPIHRVLYDALHTPEFEVIVGDPNKRNKPLRVEGIIQTAEQQKKDAISIYGYNHLLDIGRSNASQNHTLCLINASNMSPQEQLENVKGDRGQEINDYIHNPKNAFQAVVKGDIRSAATTYPQVKDLAAKASLAYERSIVADAQLEFQRRLPNENKKEIQYMAMLESILEVNGAVLSDQAKKELGDIYTLLAQNKNQLKTDEFDKELNEFTAQVPKVKSAIESLKR